MRGKKIAVGGAAEYVRGKNGCGPRHGGYGRGKMIAVGSTAEYVRGKIIAGRGTAAYVRGKKDGGPRFE